MHTAEGLLFLHGDGTILWANEAASDLLGYSRAELCRMALPVMVARGNQAATSLGPVAQGLRALLAGTAVEAHGDARFPDKLARRVALHWKLWTLPSPTRQKQILLSLSETSPSSAEGLVTSGYRDVFENAVEGIFRTTPDGRFLEVNPALARMVGYHSPAELMEARMNIDRQLYVRPNRRAEFVREMEAHGLVADFEAELWRTDGQIVWVAAFARTVRDAQGATLYFEGSVIDITARKQADAALKRSEEMFRRLAETTHVVPFEFDLTTQRFTYAGPQAEFIFGHPLRSGFSLQEWTAIVHTEDAQEGVRFAFESDYRDTRDLQTEFRVITGDGRVVWVKQIVHCGPVDDYRGHVRGFFFDVTEAKLAEVERESSRLQLRQMAARNQQVREEERSNVAREIHDELGQALTLFRLDLAWLNGRLAKTLPDDLRQPLHEKIAVMEQMIQATLQTVQRILSALRPPLLDELGLKDAIEFHMQEFSKRVGVRYVLDVAPVSALPTTVSTAVFRIFQEILTNVARHAKASRINVYLRQVDSQLILKVEDNGRGISQESLTNSKRFGILGMQERAWAIGGEVEMHRPARAGTRVTVTVPINQPELADGVEHTDSP